jgi:hypothetical protein
MAKPKAKSAPKAAAKAKTKAKPKKSEKPLTAKKAAAPAPPASKQKAAKPAKGAAPRGAPAKAPKAKAPKAAAPAAKKKPALQPTGVAKPGLGHKWSCFNCGAKFYDLGKPIPVCPKCDADQRDRPPVVAEAAPSPPQPKRPAMAPMSRFLDDDEVAAPEPDEFGTTPADADTDEPETAEVDIDALEEPAGLGEADFNDGPGADEE